MLLARTLSGADSSSVSKDSSPPATTETPAVPKPETQAAAGAASPAARAESPVGQAKADEETTRAPEEQLFGIGRSLFEQYAPAEIKEQYSFPDKQEWDQFLATAQKTLEGGSMEQLAAYEPQARAAVAVLENTPGYEEYAAWLKEQIEMFSAAGQVVHPPPHEKSEGPSIDRPSPVPHYELWLKKLQDRPKPPGADLLIPRLIAAFTAEGLPSELAWLAEVESTFNPKAKSPAGARGLFQLMPGTAKELGLSTSLPDERTDPEKSARAAARLLRELHSRFGDWQLALAAYNAGPTRVRQAMNKEEAKTFTDASPSLPAETRLYVPKVLATIAVRTGLAPETLGPPKPR